MVQIAASGPDGSLIKDVHVDYEVLRRRPEAGQMDLLLVAAKRDEISDYTQIARSAKLKPLVVDIDAFTVQNLFELSRGIPPDQTFAIINVGASYAWTGNPMTARDCPKP